MSKLCKDQKEGVVSRLASLFKEVPAEERGEVVALANDRLSKEAEDAKIRAREESFDRQVKTLLDKGYPEAAGMDKDQFLSYINPLRNKFQEGDLVVIPERFVSLPKQMSMVTINGKKGYTTLNLGLLRNADGVETPNTPYLARDVENGAVMQNTSPDNCVKQFKKQGRFGLTAEEGVALITHDPMVLVGHYIDLTGSRFGSFSVADLWLSDGRPELYYYWAGSAYSKWGSASCGSRIRA